MLYVQLPPGLRHKSFYLQIFFKHVKLIYIPDCEVVRMRVKLVGPRVRLLKTTLCDGRRVYSDLEVKSITPERIDFADGSYVKLGERPHKAGDGILFTDSGHFNDLEQS